MNAWTGEVALITGGGSGIGRALARELARRGASVVVTDADERAAADVASQLAGSAESAALDVRSLQQFRSVVADVVRRRGRIDALFNNAGVGVAGEVHELPDAYWRRVIDVNVYGVINGIQAAFPEMVRRRSGRIVNVASLAGLVSAPFLVPYAMTKHAVVGLSTSLRVEAARHGVTVTALCPAAIDTPLLDRSNPVDLPPVPWTPNIRRYLAELCAPPYPVERFARDAVDAIEKNQSVVVIPRRARVAWALGRLAPGLAERLVARVAHRERGRR